MPIGNERPRARKTSLRFEVLEDRSVPATITVTTAIDDISPNNGSVSLREAILAINAGNDLGDADIAAQSPGTFGTTDTINFNIAGSGVQTINVGADASAWESHFPKSLTPSSSTATRKPVRVGTRWPSATTPCCLSN
jgi:CSLREA domain-containing protein